MEGGERKEEATFDSRIYLPIGNKVMIQDGSGPEMEFFIKPSIHQSSKTLNLHPIPLSKTSVCLVVLRHRIPFSSRIREKRRTHLGWFAEPRRKE